MHATQYIYKGEFAFFKVDNLFKNCHPFQRWGNCVFLITKPYFPFGGNYHKVS